MRKGGAGGRALRHDVAELGLLQGDRLEPSEELLDVHRFDAMTPPFTVRFWRTSIAQRLWRSSGGGFTSGPQTACVVFCKNTQETFLLS